MRILVTGGTGFLGGAVLAELLQQGHAMDLLLLVRADSPAEGLARIASSLQRLDVPAAAYAGLSPEQIVLGDLTDVPAFAADPRLETVTHVINCAALASFSNNPLIWPINVDGTFAFAERMSRVAGLQRFLHVGTAMACGPEQPPPVHESWDLPPDEEHLVPYTASKAEIERRLRNELPGLPLVVARPSIVVGHTKLGCKPSGSIYWVFQMAQMLEAFTCALHDRVDVIPVDYCAQALVALTLKPALQHTLYHVSAGTSSSCSVAEIDLALAAGRGVEPVGERFRQVGLEDLHQLAHEFEAKIGKCNRRLMLRALRLYGGFAELNYVFANDRLLAEGIPPSPRLADYLPVCAASLAGVSVPDMMHWDFK